MDTKTSTKKTEKPEEEYTRLANLLSEKHNADVILYSGDIEDKTADRLIKYARRPDRKENIILMLATYGGSPDAAYRMARCLQRQYAKFVLYIYGVCKSAGTLVAVGANEIILSDFGEFGPLDVQLGARDELFETFSGLNITRALKSLSTRSLDTWRDILLDIKTGSKGQISTKLAAEFATNLTVGLYGRIYAQIDPAQLGQIERSVNIATDYGMRLSKKAKNVKPDAIDTLVTGYTSHTFVIDMDEAKELFHSVRKPDDLEEQLAECISWATRGPADDSFTVKINTVKEEPINEETSCNNASNESGNGAESGSSENNPAASEATS